MKLPQILVVATESDATTDYVVLALKNLRQDFYRLNTDHFPLRASSSLFGSGGALSWYWRFDSHEEVSFSEVRTVYYRRHRLPSFPENLDEGEKAFCAREAFWFIRGALLGLEAVAWMNHPLSVQTAESKLLQLKVAGALGFAVPRSMVTNDPTRVREFFNRMNGKVVAKSVRAGYIEHGTRQTSIFTSKLTATELEDLAELALAPVIFQELLPKRYDVRVTVVGEAVFAALIDSQSTAPSRIDWRATETDSLPHVAHDLPKEVEDLCRKVVIELDLTFGAIDLVLTPDGDYYFLEINPNGQWAWLQEKLSMPIAETIAMWLNDHAAMR